MTPEQTHLSALGPEAHEWSELCDRARDLSDQAFGLIMVVAVAVATLLGIGLACAMPSFQ